MREPRTAQSFPFPAVLREERKAASAKAEQKAPREAKQGRVRPAARGGGADVFPPTCRAPGNPRPSFVLVFSEGQSSRSHVHLIHPISSSGLRGTAENLVYVGISSLHAKCHNQHISKLYWMGFHFQFELCNSYEVQASLGSAL